MSCYGVRYYVCDGKAQRGVGSCQSMSSTVQPCTVSADKGSIACTGFLADGTPLAPADEPCFTAGAEACALRGEPAILKCDSGKWTVATTCASSQVCRAVAGKPACA